MINSVAEMERKIEHYLPSAATEDKLTLRIYPFVKNFLDFMGSLFLIILLSPLLLLIACIIRLDDNFHAIYTVTRVGKNGKNFKMYKFRTMFKGSDKLEDFLTESQILEYKKEYKLDDDPRLTRIGKVLRKLSLDELPQLINILKCEMSFIGPRPVLQEETELYGSRRELLLSVRPGLTGYWQAYGRNRIKYETGQRQAMELTYVARQSFLFDSKIFFKTFSAVLSKNGVN